VDVEVAVSVVALPDPALLLSSFVPWSRCADNKESPPSPLPVSLTPLVALVPAAATPSRTLEALLPAAVLAPATESAIFCSDRSDEADECDEPDETAPCP
jgi:hypothetical protein